MKTPRIIKTTLLLLGLVQSVSAATLFDPSRIEFIPSEASNPVTDKVIDLIEIDPRYTPRRQLDQKTTSTCFVHAASYLLQYYLNSTSSNPQELSIIDILGKTQTDRINRGGQPWLVLQKLRKDTLVAVEPSIDIESFAHFDDRFKDLDPLPKSKLNKCQHELHSILLKANLDRHENLKNIILQQCSVKLPKPTYRIIDAATKPSRISLPPYNIHVYESGDIFSSDQATAIKATAIHSKLAQLLRPEGSTGISYPVAFGFCSRWEKSKCLGNHALTITGISKLCKPEGTSLKCQNRWKIVNSWGGSKQGWLSSTPFIQTMLNFPNSFRFTTIRPCKSDSTAATGFSQCKPWVQTEDRLHYLALSETNEGFSNQIRAAIQRNELSLNADKDEILNAAALNGNLDFLKYLLQTHTLTFSNSGLARALTSASLMNHTLEVKFLLEDRPDLNLGEQKSGWNAVHSAASEGNLEIIQILAKAGLSIDSPAKDGRTPLHIAASHGYEDLVRFFLNQGAKPNPMDNEKWTALFAAAYQDPKTPQGREAYAKIIRHLLRAGANPNIPDEKGSTPLNIAAYRGNTKAVAFLLDAGAQTEIANRDLWTPLLAAAYRGHKEITKSLIKKGANLEAIDKNGNSALGLAISRENAAVVRTLILAGANLLHTNSEQKTIQDLAKAKGNDKITKLVQAGLQKAI